MSVNLIFKIAAVGILVTVPYIYELFETMQKLFSL